MRTVAQEPKTKNADVVNHIIDHNKFMTRDYLSIFTNRQLLMEVHPFYYDYYQNLLFPKTK